MLHELERVMHRYLAFSTEIALLACSCVLKMYET